MKGLRDEIGVGVCGRLRGQTTKRRVKRMGSGREGEFEFFPDIEGRDFVHRIKY